MPPIQSYLTSAGKAWSINLWRISPSPLSQMIFDLICIWCWAVQHHLLSQQRCANLQQPKSWSHMYSLHYNSENISREFLPEKLAPLQIINLCCTGNNGFHTPNWYLCSIKHQGNLPQMWRKTPAKLLCMCSHCTNCSHWNSPAPFVQQQSGRAQNHMHNEKKTIVKWWAKTTYRLGKDALTFCWKGAADQRGDADLQCWAPWKPCRATYRHQNKLEKALNL